MFYEYAIEPEVLSSWDRVRFFLDSFGPWKGRFLAEYPRHWKRLVYGQLVCGEIEKKRIEEKLRILGNRIFSPRVNGPYERARSWIENARIEHARQPFRAIVTVGAGEDPSMLASAQADDANQLWRVESGALVARDAATIARALALLLGKSKHVLVVDPYFIAEGRDGAAMLGALFKYLHAGATVEIHCSDKNIGYSYCMSIASRILPRVIPSGTGVLVRCWSERLGGRRLHNRYLLTDVGGVKFGDSIEHGEEGQEDHLSILDDTSLKSLWREFAGDPPAFEAAGPARTFVGTRSAGR